MSFLLFALTAASQPLPFIDRAALRVLARAEAAQLPSEARRVRTLAKLCRSADAFAAPPSAEEARALSMAGPRVSILRSACAAHRATAPVQTASLNR